MKKKKLIAYMQLYFYRERINNISDPVRVNQAV